MRILRSVVVVDNASTDATAQVARDAGAVVVRETRLGYGSAARRAISHLESLPQPPEIVAFVAGDGSDDPTDLDRLVQPIVNDNAELVVGTREPLGIWRKRASTQVALKLIGLLYRYQFEDLGPYRAIRFPALVALGLRTPGAGWNVEMQVKAVKLGLHIVEVPVSYRRRPTAGRSALGDAKEDLGSVGSVIFQIVRHATAR